MNWHVVCLDDVAPQPWRNGGGATRELLAWPSPSHWRARVSIADVRADGPFSRYADIERWFAVLEGEGLVLRVGNDENRLTPASDAFSFAGDAAVHCTLVRGATRDLNLMAARGRALMKRVIGERSFAVERPVLLALYAHGQPAELEIEKEKLLVPVFHLAWRLQHTATTVRVQAQDAFWMEVLP